MKLNETETEQIRPSTPVRNYICVRFPSVCWISANKVFPNELLWLFELQSCSSHKYGTDACESLSEGKRIESNMENTCWC